MKRSVPNRSQLNGQPRSEKRRRNPRAALLVLVSVLIPPTALAEVALEDDFDPGIDPAVWEQFGGIVEANTHARPPSTGNSLWFGGVNPRFATTKPVDTRAGGTVAFSLILSNGGGFPWEDVNLVPKQYEAVVLEYSTDGVSYSKIGSDFVNKAWQVFTIPIPPAAESATTRFRFRQLSSSSPNHDHWAIDDLTVTLNGLPDIAVEENGLDLVAGTSDIDFGTGLVRVAMAPKTFTVRNDGDFDLEDLAVEIVGDNADEFVPDVTSLDTTVVPAGSTSFTVTFTPAGVGLRTARLRITSSDPDENPFEIDLSGIGTAPEIVVMDGSGGLSDGFSEVDFGSGLPGVPRATETFTISNTGTGALTGLDVQILGTNPTDFVKDLTGMLTTVPPGGSTTFTVTFTPGALGSRAATLRILSNDLDNDQFDITLTGEGVAPDIAVSENSVDLANGASTIDYGTHLLDVASAPKSFAIQNAGTATLSGITATISGTNGTEFLTTGTVPAVNLEPGESTTVDVLFVAGGLGTRSAQLSIGSNDPDEAPFVIDLMATGQGIPEIDVEQPAGTSIYNGGAPIDFGNIATGSSSVAKVFTVNNPGTDFLTGLAVTLEGDHAAEFSLDTTGFPSSIAPTGSVTFSVTFDPTEIEGRNAFLRITSNDADENPFLVNLVGTGAATEREIVVEEGGFRLRDGYSSVFFGGLDQGYSERTISIRNVGLTDLQLSSVSIAGDDAADFTVMQSPDSSLTFGVETSITVRFQPLDSTALGERRATLVIDNNDSDENPFEIGLSGVLFGDLPDTLLQDITAPASGFQASELGHSVAISGNLIAVGSHFADVKSLNSGHVQVFDASTGAFLHNIDYPGVSGDAFFGGPGAQALSGSILVVGAEGHDSGASKSGSAWVYDLSSPTPNVPVLTLDNPTPEADDRFGSSVDISGSTVVVGCRGEGSGVVYVYDLGGADPAIPILSIPRPTGGGSNFGQRVAIDGGMLAVGLYSSDEVHVFDLDGPTPTQPSVTLDSPVAEYSFGRSIAISGTRVIVGAPFDNTGATSAGKAYAYDLTSPTPSAPLVTLTNPAPTSYGRFGSSVSVSGSRVLVGATGNERAYVFDLEAVTPSDHQLILDYLGTSSSSNYGASVALFGTQAVVGAPRDEPFDGDNGSAFLHDLAEATPTVPIHVLNHPVPATNNRFGDTVAISGDWLVIGAPQQDVGSDANVGIVEVYSIGGPDWPQPALELEDPTPTTGDWFGASVAISGSTVAVGTRYDDAGGANTGSVFIYDLEGVSPELPVTTLANPSAVADGFGRAVAISGSLVAVGAPDNSTGASSAGRVYVFDLQGASVNTPVAILDNPAPAASDQFGGTVAMHGSRVVVGVPNAEESAFETSTGLAYVFDLASADPLEPAARLESPTPVSYGAFGLAVSISGTRVAVGEYGSYYNADRYGAAYVYDLSSEAPENPVRVFLNPDPSNSLRFGNDISLVGPRLVVGVDYDDGSPGRAYLFDLDDPATTPAAVLQKPVPSYNDAFGGSLASDGARVLIGAPQESTVAYWSGGAYLYAPSPPAAMIVVEQPAGTGLEHQVSIVNFNEVPVDTTDSLVFTVRNVGGEDLTGISASLSGGDSGFFSVATNPNGTVSPGTATTFTVQFAPTGSGGTKMTTLQVTSNDPEIGVFEVTLSGTGVLEPEIAVEEPLGTGLESGSSISSFGSLEVNEVSTPKVFTVRNTGSASLTGLSLGLSGPNAGEFAIDGTGFPATLAPGNLASFSVIFSPAFLGAHDAQLQIASNDSDENPFVVNLAGSGSGEPEIAVASSSDLESGNETIQFQNTLEGAFGQTQVFTVKNEGNVVLDSLQVSLHGTGAGEFILYATGFPDFLEPRQSSTFTVQFAPTSVGSHAAELRIASNDPDENPFVIDLAGNGEPAPEITVSLPSGEDALSGISMVDFGQRLVGSRSEARVFTVRNDGLVPLNVQVALVDASGDYTLDLDGFFPNLSPGQSDTFTVTFNPSVFQVPRIAVLQIDSNDPDENPFTIKLGGIGADLTHLTERAYLKASNTDQDDHFGHAVAVYGDTVVVGAWGEGNATSGASADQNNNSVPQAGAVYVYVRDGNGAWSQEAYLKADVPEGADLFGLSVAISGDTIAVGAPGERVGGSGAVGAVYVFVRDGNGDWNQQDRLLASNGEQGDTMGWSVALDGDLLVAGAPNEDSSASGIDGNGSDNSLSSSGAAYVFRRDNLGAWSEEAYLKASNPGLTDQFGWSVALDGEWVAVGANLEDSDATGSNGDQNNNDRTDSGAVYVFERYQIGLWGQDAYLKASDSGVEHEFGAAVAISAYGELASPHPLSSFGPIDLIVGAPGNDGYGVSAGAAYVFAGSEQGWLQTEYLTGSNPGPGDEFGRSVAIRGGLALVGAPGDDASIGGFSGGGGEPVLKEDSGAVYMFSETSADQWDEQVYAKAALPEVGAMYGYSVALSGGNWVVGAPEESSNATGINGTATGASLQSGAAYAYGFDVPFVVPEIRVEDLLANEFLVSGAGVVDMGSETVGGGSGWFWLAIHNEGLADLTGVSIEFGGANPEDVAPYVQIEPNPVIGPDSASSLLVYFEPQGVGVRDVTLHIFSNDPNHNPFVVHLQGTGLAPEPEIALENGSGVDLTDGVSSEQFGDVALGSSHELDFTVRNTGNAILSVSDISLWGGNASDFQLVSGGPGEVSSGGSSSFSVRFSPIAAGTRNATLRILNNDGNEDPFEITLTGEGLDAGALLDSELLAAGLTGADAAYDATPFGDGVENLLKYAFNMNLGGPDASSMAPGGTSGLPSGQLVELEGQTYWQVQFVERIGSGLTYTPVKSSTLEPESFVALGATPTVEPIDSEWQRVIYNEPCDPATEGQCFSRVMVELP